MIQLVQLDGLSAKEWYRPGVLAVYIEAVQWTAVSGGGAQGHSIVAKLKFWRITNPFIPLHKRPVGKAIGWALSEKQYSRSLFKYSSAKKNSRPLYRIQCLEMYTVKAYKAKAWPKAIVEIGQLIRA